jgi:WD40-like Beta Propeller Repeat
MKMFEKKNIHWSLRPTLALTLLVCSMLALVMTQAAQAQKYSDWSEAVNLGPAINSAFSDQGPAISKDGLSLYITSNRPGGLGGFDMYVSQRASVDDPWGSPVNLGPTVNTAFDEGDPAFSRDGHLMFFESRRPGGFGGVDLWVSYREHTHDDFDWQPAVNLGAGVNSAADDQGPSYFENEDGAPQLYFRSRRPGGLGGSDIYVSTQMADGSFGPAVLVTELCSPLNDTFPSIRHDGLEIFFNSNRVGSIGAGDLWAATRESTLDAWSTPVNLGSTVNTSSQEQAPYLSSDGKTLFFSSGRPGGFGGLDLYVTTRTKLRGQSGN